MTKLPINPTNKTTFVDAFRIVWTFDGNLNCWKRGGMLQDIPIATAFQAGLFSAKLKAILDKIPEKGGGFAIIHEPLLSRRSFLNPDSVVFGNIELVSNSLNIDCVFADGKPIPGECKDFCFTEKDDLPAGFDVSFKDIFLDTLCVDVPGLQGEKGEKGGKGPDGLPGTGDGPQGEAGDAGEDATETSTFSGIKIIETDEITDTAVIDLVLDSNAGKLFSTKGNVKVPTSSTPADQVIATALSRTIDFNDGFDYDIVMPETDPVGKEDVALLHYPKDFEISKELDEVQVSKTPLSTMINIFIDHFQTQLDKAETALDKQCEDFVRQKDKDARDQLTILMMELATEEFKQPLEFCLGIEPSECGGGSPERLCELAGLTLGGFFCSESGGSDLGKFAIGPNEEHQIKFETSVSLPKGGYSIIYSKGTLFDNQDPARGYFVGASDAGVGVEAIVKDPLGAETTIKFPVSTETINTASATSVEQGYQNGSLTERNISVNFDADGGEIRILAPTGSVDSQGELTFQVLQCDECTSQELAEIEGLPDCPSIGFVVSEESCDECILDETSTSASIYTVSPRDSDDNEVFVVGRPGKAEGTLIFYKTGIEERCNSSLIQCGFLCSNDSNDPA